MCYMCYYNTFVTHISLYSESLFVRSIMPNKWHSDFIIVLPATVTLLELGKNRCHFFRKRCPFLTEKWFVHKNFKGFLQRIQKYETDLEADQRQDERHSLILFLTVGVGLLLYPAQFHSLHSENWFDCFEFNCHQNQIDIMGKNKNDKLRRFWQQKLYVHELEAETTDLLILYLVITIVAISIQDSSTKAKRSSKCRAMLNYSKTKKIRSL